MSYTHNQKEILCNILNNFLHETKFHSVEFSTCSITLVLKKFWILDFWVRGALLRSALEIHEVKGKEAGLDREREAEKQC
jgi:hypothetical protein